MVIVHIFCMFTRGYIYGISMITKSWVNVDDFAVAYHGIWFPSITNQSLNEISDKKNQMCLEFPQKKSMMFHNKFPRWCFCPSLWASSPFIGWWVCWPILSSWFVRLGRARKRMLAPRGGRVLKGWFSQLYIYMIYNYILQMVYMVYIIYIHV